MSDIEYSVITSDVIKSFDCISDVNHSVLQNGIHISQLVHSCSNFLNAFVGFISVISCYIRGVLWYKVVSYKVFQILF